MHAARKQIWHPSVGEDNEFLIACIVVTPAAAAMTDRICESSMPDHTAATAADLSLIYLVAHMQNEATSPINLHSALQLKRSRQMEI